MKKASKLVRSSAPKVSRGAYTGSTVCAGCPGKVHIQGSGWTPRSFAWCRLCHASFRGHQGCLDGIVQARNKHEETCLTYTHPQTRLRCE